MMMIDDNDDDYDGDDSDHSMDDMIEGTYSRTKRTSHWETRAGVFQPSLVFSPCSPVKMMMVVNGGDDEDDDDDDDKGLFINDVITEGGGGGLAKR